MCPGACGLRALGGGRPHVRVRAPCGAGSRCLLEAVSRAWRGGGPPTWGIVCQCDHTHTRKSESGWAGGCGPAWCRGCATVHKGVRAPRVYWAAGLEKLLLVPPGSVHRGHDDLLHAALRGRATELDGGVRPGDRPRGVAGAIHRGLHRVARPPARARVLCATQCAFWLP